MLTTAQQAYMDDVSARVGEPSLALQYKIDQLRAAGTEGEVLSILMKDADIVRSKLETEFLCLVAMTRQLEIKEQNEAAIHGASGRVKKVKVERTPTAAELIKGASGSKPWDVGNGFLKPDRNGVYNGTHVLNALKNSITSNEFNQLEAVGLVKKFHNRLVHKDELTAWLEKNTASIEKNTASIEKNTASIEKKSEAVDTASYGMDRLPRRDAQIDGKIISRLEIRRIFRNMPGATPEMVHELSKGYEEAFVAAKRVFPIIRKLGFFSSNAERINAFQVVCMGLDDCVSEGLITQEAAITALLLLQYSSDDFFKAMKSFIKYARGKTLGPMHLASYTAGCYAEMVR